MRESWVVGYAVCAEPSKEMLQLGKGYTDASFGDSVEVADLDAPRVVRGTIDPTWST